MSAPTARTLLRATRSSSAAPSTRTSTSTVSKLASIRAFSTSLKKQGGGGGDHYDPPTGWLFGVKPGEQYQNEGWENLYIYGFLGSLGLCAVGYAFKPDTSIQTWALEEARRRLEAEGILEDPDKKS